MVRTKASLAFSAALLLAACTTQAPRGGGARIEPGSGVLQGGAQPPVAKPAAQKKSGGYYLDDGPGDNPPDLAAISDAVPRVEPLRRAANRPYSVMGQDFVPLTELKPYRNRGMASWYGRKFHGQKTATGEIYDMYAMSAAHPTLPIPSYARVTNPANGRSVVVRVNDRGPFLNSRIMDLSYTAAWKLGYADRGSALVEVESLVPNAAGEFPPGPVLAAAPLAPTASRPAVVPVSTPASDDPLADLIAQAAARADQPLARTTALPASPSAPVPEEIRAGGIWLQLAAFSSRDNAEGFKSHLQRQLPWLTEIRFVEDKTRNLIKLQAGPYASPTQAQEAADRIRDAMDVKAVLVK